MNRIDDLIAKHCPNGVKFKELDEVAHILKGKMSEEDLKFYPIETKKIEIKTLLKNALTDKINDRTLFMKGIDISYYYEGYSKFKTKEL